MKRFFLFLGLTVTGLVLAKKIADEYDIEIKVTKKSISETPQEEQDTDSEKEEQTQEADLEEEEIEVTIEDE